MKQLQPLDALFLPFLQIPSGHHHVADALIAEYKSIHPSHHYEKVDIFGHGYKNLEKLVSSTYLTWIKYFPKGYDRLYSYLVYRQAAEKRTRQWHYESLFRPVLQKVLKQSEPKILFFTHALPSNMASILKQKGKLHAITVNVYTDFFVNSLWGIAGIDYHLVPTSSMKQFLLQSGVQDNKIFVTGIPIHPDFYCTYSQQSKQASRQLLVSGGSLGTGGMERLLAEVHLSSDTHVYVLCGHNEQLYQKLVSKNDRHITPLRYLTSKQRINQLYEQADAVITKPGGVTVSECLIKRKPLFIYDALPGQERINLHELTRLGLVQQIDKNKAIGKQIADYFSDHHKQQQFYKQLNRYFQNMETDSVATIIEQITAEERRV
ncbi:putative glycosyltransferase YkoN [Virgibacillus pantothenticus]|uniref:Uncharacterized protein n=1 Tax=Virgibacillus pantothenticus TaxID=1473 RepID=A0A0L0QME8_VIRPA|nr:MULTISPECIES: glycosyltransferase [Virgibacillus]API93460.1 hypothetical protein BKP57_17585 [Virgibacillus sp. 6R]KNE19777.1 hypothetical protein AFK71_15225 [Virgibacillus pantothenticus]MBS7430156.1 UDP-glucuronosyltransferase [Virgibacillus sp. 19R1-5]MED3737662.1 glycosyltransferase [Virgibacillus pantothenticus]QTY14677.1 UDP-glucuronosyltransferase [Virgibacillus pantothenticus]